MFQGDNLITSENISINLLKSILLDAYMDVTFSNDSYLVVKENLPCVISIDESYKHRITLYIYYDFKPNISCIKILESVNAINKECALVRACASSNETNEILAFDYEILIQGGITKKNFVFAIKRFWYLVRIVVEEHVLDIVQ